MKLKEGFIVREVAGDVVVIPSGDTLDLNMMITLNETGTFLWQKMQQETSKEQLVAALLAEYEVSPQTATAHVDTFVEKLNQHGLLA